MDRNEGIVKLSICTDDRGVRIKETGRVCMKPFVVNRKNNLLLKACCTECGIQEKLIDIYGH